MAKDTQSIATDIVSVRDFFNEEVEAREGSEPRFNSDGLELTAAIEARERFERIVKALHQAKAERTIL